MSDYHDHLWHHGLHHRVEYQLRDQLAAELGKQLVASLQPTRSQTSCASPWVFATSVASPERLAELLNLNAQPPTRCNCGCDK
jgi:hypothetical protein